MKRHTYRGRSIRSRAAAQAIERLVARRFSRAGDPSAQRGVLERLAVLSRVPRGVCVQEETVAGLASQWLLPNAGARKRPKVVLYLHGGGFVAGSRHTHRELAGRIARASGARVLVPEYRLTPEHPYPAANEDCLAAYRWLLEREAEPSQIVIGGDSAGGFLTLSTLLALRDAGDPLPAAAFLISPSTDLLHFDGASLRERVDQDPWFNPGDMQAHAAAFIGDAVPPSGELCLLERDFSGLPPLLIQVGGREVLFSDAERTAEKADSAGVSVELSVWPGQFHCFQSFAVLVPEARQAISQLGTFVSEHVPG